MGSQATELVLDAIRKIGVVKVMVGVVGGLSTLIGATWTVAVLWASQADPAQVRQNTNGLAAVNDSIARAHSALVVADAAIESDVAALASRVVTRDEFTGLRVEMQDVGRKLDRLLCRQEGNSPEYCERAGGDGP